MPKIFLIIWEVPVYKKNIFLIYIDQSFLKIIKSHIRKSFRETVVCTYGNMKGYSNLRKKFVKNQL